MKMTYIHVTILTDNSKWKVLCGKEKYLLNSLREKLKNTVSLKQM